MPKPIDPLEQQMISRYLDMRKRVESLYKEAEKLHEDASAFAYANIIQFPDFIDHVSEQSGPTNLTFYGGLGIQKEERLTPSGLVQEVLCHRGGHVRLASIEEQPRKPNETARHWMQRLEKDVEQRKKQEELERQERERRPWRVRVSPKTGEPCFDERRFVSDEEAKTAALEIANAKSRRKLKEIAILCRNQKKFYISWDKAGKVA
jgi:hypothetical protein